ncbi:MAG: hypothetical protein H8E46_07515 [FCB group bacterium]|nr:hypothetical protein [FCB group bacterium]
MANIESAVVVYLRELYYPGGFTFPIVNPPLNISLVEIGREAATIILLLSAAKLAFKKPLHQFCVFMYCFGVWDIFYYIWLYVFLGWPESLLTWDILFLIPLPWLGPVLAPVIVSISMIIAAVIILKLENSGIQFRIKPWHWAVTIAAGLIIILSFVIDYKVVTEGTVPETFKWGIFLFGEILGIAVFVFAMIKSLQYSKSVV